MLRAVPTGSANDYTLSELHPQSRTPRSWPTRPCTSTTIRDFHQQRGRRRRGFRSTWSGTDYHRVATMIDPTTGLPRLIFGNDQGVWSVLDNNGTFETSDRVL